MSEIKTAETKPDPATAEANERIKEMLTDLQNEVGRSIFSVDLSCSQYANAPINKVDAVDIKFK